MERTANNRYKLTLRYPTSWWNNKWREGLPSGNGRIGASVYGAVKEETIMLTHEDLWHWGRKAELPDVSYTLPETRKLMDEEKYLEASWHLTKALQDRGYNTELASRFPLADLKLTMVCEQAFKQYRRSLDMETGEVTVQWQDGEKSYARRLFVSRADDAIIYEITAGGHDITGALRLKLHPTDDPNLVEACKEIEATVQVKAAGNYLYYAARNDDGSDFGAVMHIVTDAGVRSADQQDAIHFQGASRVLAIVKLFVKGDREQDWARLRSELSVIPTDYKRLLAAHVDIHGELFHSVNLELGEDDGSRTNEELLLDAYEGEAPTELVQKMWAYGRYLFISGTHAEGYPFGLYGLWGGDHQLTWCHNMANENVQMIYWHVPAGGLMELMPALIRYYDSMMDDFRANAQKLYGCRGIYIPAGSTPGIGVPNQVVPVIMNWTGTAAWLARHYYEYYLYTGDRTLLVDKVLPFMREAVLFYEDFVVLDQDGQLKFYPSVSPENTPENFMPTDGKPLAHPMPTTINATMDCALLKELLTHLIEGSREAGVYDDDIMRWELMLQRIPDYKINADGAIREWMDERFDDRYNHRHLSHIYPIFPGQEFTREEHPQRFEAFETAVNKRLLGAQTGWSLGHMAAIYARLGDGNKALTQLDILSRSCLLNNFMTLHNDWRDMGICMNMEEAPIQLDANMGWVNAVQEMLLYVSPTMVKLLPALPDRWTSGSVSGMRFCAGKVSFSWNKENDTFHAELIAERDTTFTLKLPAAFNRCNWLGRNVSYMPSKLGNDCYDVAMTKGGKLIISISKE
ncbi:alpha-L-fucosidase 2 [Paenibacillus cellulosilyticus]|uniref:Alpha-L-fucosidase 2 n=1 Tax=Paenibacillus cellulosilyticus TaxID=375489 RepID=A0A2V2YTQ2_9BACL|nr:glycoside hydrolase N-terminal domain-containing protein [Paenibacillus cellulosilyticus]PWW02878.1 alpha-L-fucosidase 2 [Paenibacillus cellulosilyticus]QKS45791.1 glycoside hydrolase N-terminal domain-containing protein [Paenibacillus cellulosilyticus]